MSPSRSWFLAQGGTDAAFMALAGCHGLQRPRPVTEHRERLFFTSQGRTAVINADGSELFYFDFQVPDHPRWLPTMNRA